MIFDNVMNMKSTLTITSKGQTTLPIALRRLLGVDSDGGVLTIKFDEKKGEAIITKAPSFEDLSATLTGYIKPGTVPITDANKFYQANRSARS